MPQSLEERESPFHRAAESNVASSVASSVKTTAPDTTPKNGEWVDEFLTSVMQGMSVKDATAVAGVHPTLPYKRRIDDEAFRRAWVEASEIGTEFLEHEAARRAYHGVLKPVFYKGEECGKVREYSDTLLMFLLKARRPDKYREGVEDGAGRGNITLNVSVVNTERIEQALPEVVLIDAPAIGVEVVSGSEDGGQDDSSLPEADAVPRE